jgi:hypothetical protein
MLRVGAVTCASCGAAVVIAAEADAGVYSTEPGGWPPRARSRRHARELIRRVGGHEHVGAGRETQWRVTVEAYHRHYRRKVATRETKPMAPVVSVDQWINAAGYRSTKRTGT